MFHGKTVIRGGFGMFTSPGHYLESLHYGFIFHQSEYQSAGLQRHHHHDGAAERRTVDYRIHSDPEQSISERIHASVWLHV